MFMSEFCNFDAVVEMRLRVPMREVARQAAAHGLSRTLVHSEVCGNRH
jgi:hypothetical protein